MSLQSVQADRWLFEAESLSNSNAASIACSYGGARQYCFHLGDAQPASKNGMPNHRTLVIPDLQPCNIWNGTPHALAAS